MDSKWRALRVKQWLTNWGKVRFSSEDMRMRPDDHFFVFNAPAVVLRRLSGISRRKASGPRIGDLGIQRRHEEERCHKIARYLRFGYPWSELNTNDMDQPLFSDLAMPGWLPTAIVANIIPPGSHRYGSEVHPDDQINIKEEGDGDVRINVPPASLKSGWRAGGWETSCRPPDRSTNRPPP